MQKTYYPKTNEINREWFVVDANDQNLGRLTSRIAPILIGKHKAIYTPGVDTGDFCNRGECKADPCNWQ